MRNKTYSFTTEIQPEAEILLSGSHGKPLTMSITDPTSSKSVVMDTDSVTRLQAFLTDYLTRDEVSSTAPVYEPTGRALAVMDGDTLDFVGVFITDKVAGLGGCESDSYEVLSAKVRAATEMELPPKAVFVFFNLYDGTISRGVVRRVLRACVSYQVEYVRTADVTRCRRMGIKDIEDFTSIDKSVVSRCTRKVLILSPKGTFTLDSTDPSLERPSLFDEGAKKVGGGECSRKEVLSVMREAFVKEDLRNPWTDEGLTEELVSKGYDIARRTVSKYREMLGVGKRSDRRIRK